MSLPIKITFILKSPLLQSYVDEFSTDLGENIKVETVIKQKFDSNIINDVAPLIIWIVTSYSEGIITAFGEKTIDIFFSKLKVFFSKYCDASNNKSTDIRIKITEGKTKYEFEATNVTKQTADKALSDFRSILINRKPND